MTNKKIEALTPSQEAALPVYVEKFVNYGLSTRESTEEDFRQCFDTVVSLYRELSEDLSGDNRDHAPNDIPTTYEVYDSPRAIWLACKNKEFPSESSYGACESGWLSHYIFMRDEVGVVISDRLKPFYFVGQHCFWWYVDTKTKKVYFSRKPVEIHMVNKLLHNELGPSILFRDGFSVYSINGFRVTRQIAMHPETMTLDQIDRQQNKDIQSIMIERWFYKDKDWANKFGGDAPPQSTGWLRYIEESNAVELDSDVNPLTQIKETLYKTKVGNRLIVGCPTGRMFQIGIPDDVHTCEGARNWYPPILGGKTNFIART